MVANEPHPKGDVALADSAGKVIPLIGARGYSEQDAATYLGLSRSTLRKSRMEGARSGHIPPVPFVRAGRRIIYLLDDLNGWLEDHRVSYPDRCGENAARSGT